MGISLYLSSEGRHSPKLAGSLCTSQCSSSRSTSPQRAGTLPSWQVRSVQASAVHLALPLLRGQALSQAGRFALYKPVQFISLYLSSEGRHSPKLAGSLCTSQCSSSRSTSPQRAGTLPSGQVRSVQASAPHLALPLLRGQALSQAGR